MQFTSITLASPANLFAFSSDDRLLAVVHRESFSVLDVALRTLIAEGPLNGVVYACAFTPDASGLLLGTRTPTLVDLATRKTRKPAFKGPSSAANAIAFSADGSTAFFANGSFMAPGDCFVYAFDLATHTLKWKVPTSEGDGNTGVVTLGNRVLVFGEQGMIFVLDAAKGASIARYRVVPPAPYGESLLSGDKVDDASVLVATLEEGAPLVARVHAIEGALVPQWRTRLVLPEADADGGVLTGRPKMTAGGVQLPVVWCLAGEPRVSLFTLDPGTGAVLGSVVLEGCASHHAVACSRGGALVWSPGGATVAFAAAPGGAAIG